MMSRFIVDDRRIISIDVVSRAVIRHNPWWIYQRIVEEKFSEDPKSVLRYLPSYGDERSEFLISIRRYLLEYYSSYDRNIGELARTRWSLHRVWYPNLFHVLKEDILKNVTPPAILTLRGPRQVGKTTLVKLLIIELLSLRLLKHVEKVDFKTAHYRRIFYFPCDTLMGGKEELLQVLADFIDRASRVPDEGPIMIFLDEVSSLKGWQEVIKVLYDDGSLSNVILLATGSHSLDIKKSSEVLAGRRGNVEETKVGPDSILLPMKFIEYVKLLSRELREVISDKRRKWFEPDLDILLNLAKGEVDEKLYEFEYYLGDLRRFLDDYMVTGGIVRAAREYDEKQFIPDTVYKDYADLVVKDAERWRLNERNLRKTLYAVFLTMGSPVSARTLAKKVGLTHQTIENYLEYLEGSYAVFQLYRLDLNRKMPEFRKARKIYFVDPFIMHALNAWVYGYPEVFEGSAENLRKYKPFVMECVVASHLARLALTVLRSPLRLVENTIFYWRQDSGEVDFIFRLGNEYIPVEVGLSKKASKTLFRLSRILNKKGILTGYYDRIMVEERIVRVPIEILLLLA
ncbi:MAG: hypothetical protein DRJ44_02905 [Thermoprotei archaeon]|nr:MAG: hypothetical protein DRJ44_02905 [Thermoprotei archaeon]